MNLLLLHHHFKTPASGGALRSYFLAKALVEKGIRVDVITTRNQPKLSYEELDGIHIHYLPIAYDNRFGFAARSISFLKFIWKSFRHAGRLKNIDLCYAISTPLTTGIAALLIRWRMKIPFVFEVGDLWPDAPIQLGVVKNPLLKKFLYGLELRIYRKAQAIVALSVPIQQAVANKISGKRIYVIPNFSDFTYFEKLNHHSVDRAESPFVITYAGAVGYANGLHHVVECAVASQQAALPIHFNVAGDGAELPSLKKQADEKGLKNIAFAGMLDREATAKLLLNSDACFVSFLPAPILETGSPHKYFDGLAAGKMIIVNFGGWIKKEIEDHDCGIWVDSKNPGDFVQKIRGILEDRSRLVRYQQNASRLAKATYDRPILNDKFVHLIQEETAHRVSLP